ncbi:4884_t:CDS:2, partial [Gigaspora margarita]
MFLNGLKDNNATFVAVAAPKNSKNLSKAIAVARRVEASNYYGQQLSKYEMYSREKCEERSHIARNCMSEKSKYPYNNQRKEKENFNLTKNISFCELEDTNDEEIYIVNNITSIKATKRLANFKWEDRLLKSS